MVIVEDDFVAFKTRDVRERVPSGIMMRGKRLRPPSTVDIA